MPLLGVLGVPGEVIVPLEEPLPPWPPWYVGEPVDPLPCVPVEPLEPLEPLVSLGEPVVEPEPLTFMRSPVPPGGVAGGLTVVLPLLPGADARAAGGGSLELEPPQPTSPANDIDKVIATKRNVFIVFPPKLESSVRAGLR